MLGAFKGQTIKPIYRIFSDRSGMTKEPYPIHYIKYYVSHCGINLIGRDGQAKLYNAINPDQFDRVAVTNTPKIRLLSV